MGSCRARSVYLTTRLLGRLSYKRLTNIVHILSPKTDNCPSWISGRERMTVENISWSISTKECCRPRRRLNPRPPGLQSDGASNWATISWSISTKECCRPRQGLNPRPPDLQSDRHPTEPQRPAPYPRFWIQKLTNEDYFNTAAATASEKDYKMFVCVSLLSKCNFIMFKLFTKLAF